MHPLQINGIKKQNKWEVAQECTELAAIWTFINCTAYMSGKQIPANFGWEETGHTLGRLPIHGRANTAFHIYILI